MKLLTLTVALVAVLVLCVSPSFAGCPVGVGLCDPVTAGGTYSSFSSSFSNYSSGVVGAPLPACGTIGRVGYNQGVFVGTPGVNVQVNGFHGGFHGEFHRHLHHPVAHAIGRAVFGPRRF